MNAWLIGALAMLPGFIGCGFVIWRRGVLDAVIAVDLASVLGTLELVLLAEGLGHSSFYDLALVLAVLSLGSGLVYARFLDRRL